VVVEEAVLLAVDQAAAVAGPLHPTRSRRNRIWAVGHEMGRGHHHRTATDTLEAQLCHIQLDSGLLVGASHPSCYLLQRSRSSLRCGCSPCTHTRTMATVATIGLVKMDETGLPT